MRVLALAAGLLSAVPVSASALAADGAGAVCPVPAASGGAAAAVGTYPAPGSCEAASELAVVLWAQQTRTAADVARAVSEEDLSLEDYAAVLGTALEPGGHPLTEALLARAVADSRPCVSAAKRASQRPRPFAADARVKPAVHLEKSASFPSGHATRGALLAALLAELAPEHRDALIARGAQIGHDRVLAGVHYPSDVAAGARLGRAVAQALLADPAFRSELERVRGAEWRGAGRGREPAP